MSENSQRPTLWNVIVSVLAAMFGVQTEHNRKRDFNQGNPLAFIIVGVIFIVLFVLSIYGLVSLLVRLNQ
ncbi:MULTISPECIES: DUF2970 domain-containing protein [Gammaproteobacteria]|uniref:DUF2970 domain-containing protein n=1 Tax=Gammaproteobacteria TaxID=1236 RepID=UPI000DCF8FD4|nr:MULTISPECIES: DUF2970 domain-containing protein [Gammaproteobacteria]RTE85721.1 DUF2970 domain-containing protein [Aliidiomarina sp. B3213]TCZ90277.1 DUF2970 domain-containing protein [Lysobacter sp. N42]